MIDRGVYDEHTAQIKRDLASVRADLAACGADVPDLVAIFQFADELLTDLAGWWRRLDAAGRVGLLGALYPAGLPYGRSGFGTAESPLLVGAIRAHAGEESREVPPAGFEPALPP